MPLSRTSQEWSDLVEQVLSGDETAVAQFAGDIGMILNRFLLSSGTSPADAEDLAVSCTSDIFLALDGYKEKGRFEAWMFQIVRNQRVNELRDRPELLHLIEDDWLALYDRERNRSDDQDFPNNGRLRLPVHQALENALLQLHVADLRLIEGRHARTPATFEELGLELGLTAGNARVRFHRVLQKLEAMLLTDDRILNWLGDTSSVSSSSRTPSTEESSEEL